MSVEVKVKLAALIARQNYGAGAAALASHNTFHGRG